MSFEARLHGWLARVVAVRPHEAKALLWSFAYFFCLLAGYYVLRPVRDEMGLASGIKNLPWLFTATFLVMLAAVPLYGALVARLPRRRFIPLVYHFFVANIVIFWVLLTQDIALATTAKVFFRLDQRVQPVRGVGVLVVHGGPLWLRAGQAPVRVHRRRRFGGRAARADHSRDPRRDHRPRQSADHRRAVAGMRGVLRDAPGIGRRGVQGRNAPARRNNRPPGARADLAAAGSRAS